MIMEEDAASRKKKRAGVGSIGLIPALPDLGSMLGD